MARRDTATRWEGGRARISVGGNFHLVGAGAAVGVHYEPDNFSGRWSHLFDLREPGFRDITLAPGWIEVKLTEPDGLARAIDIAIQEAPSAAGAE